MHRRQWLLIICSALLLFSPVSTAVLASPNTPSETDVNTKDAGEYETKDEVIYGNLDVHGNPKNLYVVNSFHVTSPGEMVDYGTYTDIRNLTNLTPIEQREGYQTHFFAEEGDFYYQGELEGKKLPWDISIVYLFNGEEVSPSEMAGKSGDFDIHIRTSANETVDPLFFENYLLQIDFTLNPEVFGDIQAPKGTEANAGKDKQVSFTVLPEQSEELILSAKVTDFEMNPIDISAIPANIAIDMPEIGDMTKDMASLSEAIREVNKGVSGLRDGVSELHSGLAEMNNGSTQYKQGINKLDRSSGELTNGSKEIHNALNMINEGLQDGSDTVDMGELQELPESLREIAAGLEDIVGEFVEIEEGYDEFQTALQEAIEKIPKRELTEADIKELYETDLDQEKINILVENYVAAQLIKEIHVGEEASRISEAISEILGGIPEEMSGIVSFLYLIADGIESLDDLDGLAELQTGLATLSAEYGEFHNGLVEFTNGLHELATSYHGIDAGIQELTDGTSALQSGVRELHEGTEELYAETSDLPEQMESEIDEFMADYDFAAFEQKSFVSDKNTKVDVVQFVLQTESIKVAEEETTDDEAEEEKGFWKRLFDLFRS